MTSGPGMTSDHTDGDHLAPRATGALRQRAARVAVDDRLDQIAGPGEWPGRTASHLGPGRPLSRGGRLVFAAAALVAGVALTLALWQRGGQEPLVPITGPSADGARIYPELDPAVLASFGLGPEAGFVIQRDSLTMTGPALVLGRIDGENVRDLVTVSVEAAPATGGGEVSADPIDPVDLTSGLVAPVTRSVGARTVRLPYGTDGTADLVVWLRPGASQAEIDPLRTLLEDALVVRSFTYTGPDATWDTFRQHYASRPELLDLVDPADLPTSFQVDLEIDDHAVVEALQAEWLERPGVVNVNPGVAFQRYQWDEAGATMTVDLAPGSDLVVDDLITALRVTPQATGLPSVAVQGQLPSGLVVLAGPAGPVAEPLPWLSVIYGTGASRIMITAQPAIDPRSDHSRVTVGGRDGYLSEQDGGITLTWPLDDHGWWAQLVGHGLTNGQAVAVANAVTYTDLATWTARYPAQPATTFETAPPTTNPTLAAPPGPNATVDDPGPIATTGP